VRTCRVSAKKKTVFYAKTRGTVDVRANRRKQSPPLACARYRIHWCFENATNKQKTPRRALNIRLRLIIERRRYAYRRVDRTTIIESPRLSVSLPRPFSFILRFFPLSGRHSAAMIIYTRSPGPLSRPQHLKDDGDATLS